MTDRRGAGKGMRGEDASRPGELTGELEREDRPAEGADGEPVDAGGEPGAGADRREPEDGGSELGSAPGKRPGPLRRLYDWVLHWAYTPHGPWALFVLSLAESSFFPIPPDPLLMALCLGAAKKALRFAAIATFASVVGGLIGYAIGAGLWGAAESFFYAYVPGVSPEAFARVQGLYERYDFWAIFMAGLTPIPYKVFTISAGVFDINLGIFVLASVCSRGLRFFAEAALIHRWGEPMGRFIDEYFDLLSWVFGALLVGGFLVIEFVL